MFGEIGDTNTNIETSSCSIGQSFVQFKERNTELLKLCIVYSSLVSFLVKTTMFILCGDIKLKYFMCILRLVTWLEHRGVMTRACWDSWVATSTIIGPGVSIVTSENIFNLSQSDLSLTRSTLLSLK